MIEYNSNIMDQNKTTIYYTKILVSRESKKQVKKYNKE